MEQYVRWEWGILSLKGFVVVFAGAVYGERTAAIEIWPESGGRNNIVDFWEGAYFAAVLCEVGMSVEAQQEDEGLRAIDSMWKRS